MAIPKNSVWSAMDYIPPRGPCNFKLSLISGTCSCMRFMLHPVKAAASFECDGCNHHASFHALENTAEDAVLMKWARSALEDTGSDSGRKRRKVLSQAQSTTDLGGRAVELTDEPMVTGINAKQHD